MEKDLGRPQEDEQVATSNAGREGAGRFLRSAALAAQVTAALVGINALLEPNANAEHRNGRVVVGAPPEITHGDVQEVEAEMNGVIVGSELRTNGKVSIEVSLDEGKKRTNGVTREPKRTVQVSVPAELQGQRVSIIFSGERKGGNLFRSKITIRVPAILVAKSGSTVRLKNRIDDADLTKDDIIAINALLAALGGSGQLFGTRADFIPELLKGAEKDPEARIDAKTDGEKADDVFREDVVIKLTFDRRATDVNGLLLSLGRDERPADAGSDVGSSCGRCVAKRPTAAAPKGPEQGTVLDSFIMDACTVISGKDPFSDTGTSLSFRREGADVWPVTADGSSKDLEFDVVPVDEKDRIGSQMAAVTVTGVSKDGRTFKYRTVLPVGFRSQCNFRLVSASPAPGAPGTPGAQAATPAASIKPGEFATQVAGLIKDGKLNLSASGAENLLHILFGDAQTNAEIEMPGLPASLKAALQDAVLSGYVNGEAENTGIKRTLRLHMDKEFTGVAIQELLSLLHLDLTNNLPDGALDFDLNLDFPKLSVQIFSQGKLIAVQNNAVALNPGQTYPNIAMRILIQGQKNGDKIAGKAVVDVNTELPDGRNVKEGAVTSYAELIRRLMEQPPKPQAPAPAKLPPFAPPPVAKEPKVPPPATQPSAGKAGTGLHPKAAKKHGRHGRRR